MAKTISRILRFVEKESLSCHLILLAITLNVWAWIIPRGDYRYPERDGLGVARWVSAQFSDIASLHYFWNAVLSVTVMIVGYSAWKASTALLDALRDRVDL